MKSFNEIYEQIYKDNNEELSKLNRKNKIYIMLFILAIIPSILCILNIFSTDKSSKLVTIIVALIIIIVDIKLIKSINSCNSKYKKMFKNNVITAFVKNVDKNINYYPEKGISSTIYLNGEFERHFDIYSSEDAIEGILDEKYKVRMAEVHTQIESEDSEGNTTTNTLFRGIFGNVECAKNTNIKLKAHIDKGIFENLFKNKSKIEMDSSEFEKYFDINTDNKIVAMQILTSDVVELMIKFREESKIKYEFTLNNNQIYLRFHTGAVFEPRYFKGALDYDTLKKYYDIVNFVFEVTREINKAIETANL